MILKKINVFITDDHQLFREGMRLILSNLDYIDSIFEAADGAEFLSFINDGGTADVIFMDLAMPIVDGVEATKQALKIDPNLNIIGLSMYSDEDYYTKMINAGAKGFVLKNSGIRELEAAIEQVLQGNNYFSHEILNNLVNNINKKNRQIHRSELSEREEEVLFQICKGLSNQEIADKLFISKRTVDKHRENLLLKTGSKNTVGLVIYAIKNGIVEV